MEDPLDQLYRHKIQKYYKKKEISASYITTDNLLNQLQVLQHTFFNADSNSITSVYNTDDFIYFGTNLGNVLVYKYDTTLVDTVKPQKKINSCIISIDVWNNTHAVFGYSTGQVILWDLKSNKSLGAVISFPTPVLKLKFSQGFNTVISLADTIHIIEYKKKLIKYSHNISTFQNLDKKIITFELLSDPSLDTILLIISFETLAVYSLKTNAILFNFSSINPAAIPYTGWTTLLNKYVIAVSFDKTIVIYNILKESFNGSFCFESDQDVCGLKWVQNNLLIVLSRYSDIRVYSLDNNKKTVMQEIRINVELYEQKYLINQTGLLSSTFHNSFSGTGKFIVLGTQKIFLFSVCDWNDTLNILATKKKWIQLFNLAYVLFQNKTFGFINSIPNKYELLERLQVLLAQYLSEDNADPKEKVSCAIEFGVKYGLVDKVLDILFQSVFVDNLDEKFEYFINQLEYYLLNKDIEIVNQEYIQKIVDFLANKKLYDLIENILLHLKPSSIDAKGLVNFCDKYNLIDSYIYISTQSSLQSYLNPLKKLYKLTRKATEKPKKQYYAYNLLLVLKLNYTGKQFPDKKMQEETKEKVIIKSTDWIFKRKHIETLLEIDSTTTLNTIKLILPVLKVFDSQSSISVPQIVSKLESFLDPNSAYFYEIVQIIIDVYNISKVTISKKSTLIVSKHLIQTSINSGVPDKTISSIIVSLLKSNQPYDPSEISDLFKPARTSRLTQVLSYLYELKSDFQESIICYIQCDDPDTRVLVFSVIDNILKNIPQESLPGFKQVLTQNLNRLSEINTELVGNLIANWFQNEHSLTISKLSSSPKLQMQYLSDLLRNSSTVEEDLVLLYIKLLCEYKPEALIGFLKSSKDYSYQACLKIVSAYKHIEAISYAQEKLGSIKESILTIINHIKDIKYNISKVIKANQEIQRIELIELKNYIYIPVEICERNAYAFENKESDEIWYVVLNNCLDLYTELSFGFGKNPDLKDLLDDGIKFIIENMINKVDFQNIITLIVKNHGSFPFKYFKDSTITVLSQLSYTKNIISKANSLLISDKSILTENLIENHMKGVCSDDFYCTKCKENIEIDNMLNPDNRAVIFECGHMFHFTCIKRIITCEGCKAIESRNKKFFESLKIK
jgi:Golgi CORVET complex core vacuolar protein 8